MDIILSIVAGLGLRAFLFTSFDPGPFNPFTAALLGLWEGAVVHQLSGRSASPHLDHILAYVLRVILDLLISRSFQRLLIVLVSSAVGSTAAELLIPHASLRLERRREREHAKDKKQRHSRSNPNVPIIAVPLPPRVRAYRHPEQGTITTQQLPQHTSTPHNMRPTTPPSFFLHENSELYSPPPKPVQIQPFKSSSPIDALPVRPPSGLASILERSPDSGSLLPVPNNLPTPPDSSESVVPSDHPVNDEYDERQRPLSTIQEVSGDENSPADQRHQDHHKGDIIIPHETNQHNITVNYAPSIATTNAPLPVPNAGLRYIADGTINKWLTSQASKQEPIFGTPFSPTSNALPVPVPFRNHLRDPLFQIATPNQSDVEPEVKQGEDGVFEVQVGNDNPADIDADESGNESDELLTPGAKAVMNLETDNEHDELRTPIIHANVGSGRQAQGSVDPLLSPLPLNLHSAMNSSEEHIPLSSKTAAVATEQAPLVEANPTDDELAIPGSLSMNLLLQPPLPPSGPLVRHRPSPIPSPGPPSPSTLVSEASDVSILSTRMPNKLYNKGDEIRKQAWEKEQLRTRLDAERKRAENEKRVGDALKLKIRIREVEREVLKLHEKAARRYYAARNPLQMSTKIDVHGLRSREAFERVERALLKVIEEGKTTLRVIVGKGLHSVNNQPVLKNTVQREMLRQGFKCEIDARNPGILIITIPQMNQAS